LPIPVIGYTSVNAKTRALFGKLLTKQDYEELLTQKTVGEIAAYLKKSAGYGEVLASINENLVHRGELEKLFSTSHHDDYVKLMRFLEGNAREFMKALFLRHEVEELKMLLRIIYTGRKNEAIINTLVFLKKYSALDFNRLVNSSDLPDFIMNLKGSEYYRVLSRFLGNFRENNLFDIETSLDIYYFMKVLNLKDKLLSGGDLKSVTNMLGVETDIANLQMIYRCKKLFKLPAEMIYKYIIPYWYHLTRKELVALTQSGDTNEFRQLVSETKYSDIFRDDEHLWELNAMNYAYRMYKSHFRKGTFNFGMLMAYLHLKEFDIRNIITIIEGVRYKVPKDEIKSYLIGVRI